MRPLRRSPNPSPEQAAQPVLAQPANLPPPAEVDVLDPAVGQASHAKSPKRNCTENDERSLNVIENAGCGKGISWNVIDKTGG